MSPFTSEDYDALPEVLTTDQVAQILNSSPFQVRRWVNAGVIPGVLVARRWRFSKSRLEEFIAQGGAPQPD